jgi:electron transfer flavoprotein alpha/beta subunit
VEKGKYDLILTGAQADDGAAQVGGMLAAMLDYPYASLVNKLMWKAINSRWAVKLKVATRR